MDSGIKPKYIFAVAISFFVFQLFLFIKSFPALYALYLGFVEAYKVSDFFWVSLLASSEIIGEIGLIVRFAGASFALLFAWRLARNGHFVFSHLRKAVFLEGSNYLFLLPFITAFFATPNTSIITIEAGFSYTLQIVLVSLPFLVLYSKMRKPDVNLAQMGRWVAIAAVGFTFALWVKHFFMNLYALQVNLEDPILLAGLLNSVLTMFIAGIILLVVLLPVIRKHKANFNSRAVGVAFLLIGFYFVVFIVVSILSVSYLTFLSLTDLWALALIVPGLGLIRGK